MCAEGNAGKPVQSRAEEGKQHLFTDDNYHIAQSQIKNACFREKKSNLIKKTK